MRRYLEAQVLADDAEGLWDRTLGASASLLEQEVGAFLATHPELAS
jgi:hypothetical protein